MPTKRMFDMVLLETLGVLGAIKLYKLWAARTKAEPGFGAATTVAGAVSI